VCGGWRVREQPSRSFLVLVCGLVGFWAGRRLQELDAVGVEVEETALEITCRVNNLAC
jgi:hypothetical protein